MSRLKPRVQIEKLREQAVLNHVQSPSQQAANFKSLATDLADTSKRLSFNNPFDEILRPLVPGDLMGLLARTGNGKTTLSLAMAREMAQRIQSGELGDENSIVLFVSLEQNADHVEMMLAGNGEFDSSEIIRGNVSEDYINSYAATRPSLPLWTLGQTRAGFKRGYEQLYLDGVIESVEGIIFEYGKHPVVLFVDYLQQARLREGSFMNRHQQVMYAAEELKRLAMRLDIPIIVGSQAKQEVDNYADKQPQLSDSTWAADMSFVSDTVVSIQFLSRNFDPDLRPEVEIGGRFYENTGNTMVARVLKQRFDRGYGQVGFQFIPQILQISSMDHIDLNNSNGSTSQKYQQIEFEALDL